MENVESAALILKQLEESEKSGILQRLQSLKKLENEVLNCSSLGVFLIERFTDFDDAATIQFFARLLDRASQKAKVRNWHYIYKDLHAAAADLREKVEGVH